MDLDGRGDGEKWRGRENVIRMYCTKKKLFSIKKNVLSGTWGQEKLNR